jgi:pyruvate formate lyase activating enzyme
MLAEVAFRKTSLIDFPGRVASVLFLPGCNFRCPYCHNAALVDPSREGESLSPLGAFLAHIEKRKRLISGVTITGGEPLLHEETPRISRSIRDRGLAVKLDTNGYFPERVEAVGARYVALDLKTAPSGYARVAPGLADAGDRAAETLRLLRKLDLEFEVRITCVPGIVGPAEIEEIAGILDRGDRVILQPFRPGGCLNPAWDAVEPYGATDMAALLALLAPASPLARIRG